MTKQVTEASESKPYAEMSKQQKGGFMLWLKSKIEAVISLKKDIRDLERTIPLEVQDILDNIALYEKQAVGTKKSIYAKAKEIRLRTDIVVDFAKLTHVMKQYSLKTPDYFENLKSSLFEKLKEAGLPEESIALVLSLLVDAHNVVVELKDERHSFTLYTDI